MYISFKSFLLASVPALIYDLALYIWYPCLGRKVFHGELDSVKVYRLCSALGVTLFSIGLSLYFVCLKNLVYLFFSYFIKKY